MIIAPLIKSNILILSPKRVKSLRGSPPRHCDQAAQLLRRNVAAAASRWQHCVRFDRHKFKPQAFRSRNDQLSAQITVRLLQRKRTGCRTEPEPEP